MAGVLIKVDDQVLRARLRDAMTSARNMRGAWQQVGEILHRSIMENFEAGGRPQHWKPLRSGTLIARVGGKRKAYTKKGKLSAKARKQAFGHKPLIVSARLMRSITYRATTAYAEAGTNVVYAAVHQFGLDEDKRGRKLNIPARPYLLLQDEDLPVIESTIEKHILGGLA